MTNLTRLATSAFLVIGATGAGIANAQNEPAAGVLAEIVVTAQRRETRLQDTPESVGVLTEASLVEQNLSTFEDYAFKLPSVQFSGTDGIPVFGEQVFFIRGLSSGGTASMYIDEMTIGNESPPRLIDVDRIEVLKGPQGTLYGEGTMGGALRVISNQPEFNEWSGRFSTGLSTIKDGGYDHFAEAVLNIPLFDDRLAIRLAPYHESIGGFVDSLPFRLAATPDVPPEAGERRKDANERKIQGAKVGIRWQATEDLTISLNGWFDEQEQTSENGVPVALLPQERYEQFRAFDHSLNSQTLIGNVTVEYQLPFATFLSATSYFDREFDAVYDGTTLSTLLGLTDPSVPGEIGQVFYDIPRQRITEEMRLVSEGDGPFTWVIGGFFLDTSQDLELDLAAIGAPPLPGLIEPGSIYLQAIVNSDSRQAAGFGDFSYEMLPRLTATFGVRWTSLEADVFQESLGIPGFAAPAEFLPSQSEDFTFKGALSYEFDSVAGVKDGLLYASFKQGFREGFGIVLPPAFCDAELAALGITNPSTQVDPDTVNTYEAGTKLTFPFFAGGSVRANAAVFHTDWKDVQQSVSLNCGFDLAANLGSATVDGVEWDLFASFEGIDVGVTGSWLRARFDEQLPGQPPNRLMELVPEWQINALAKYSFPIVGEWTGYLGGDFQYMSERAFDPSVLAFLPRFEQLNFRFGVDYESWQFQLFVENALDRYQAIGQPLQIPGENRAALARPRTVGVRINYAFD